MLGARQIHQMHVSKLQQLFCRSDIKVKSSAYSDNRSQTWLCVDVLLGLSVHRFAETGQRTEMRFAKSARSHNLKNDLLVGFIHTCYLSGGTLALEFFALLLQRFGHLNSGGALLGIIF